MKKYLLIIGLVLGLVLGIDRMGQAATNTSTESFLIPPNMEFEEVEKQLKSFLMTNPVDLSQHFASLCSYSSTTIKGQELFRWILKFENRTNQNSRLEHFFQFHPEQGVDWHGYRVPDLEQCDSIFMQVGASNWEFHLDKDGTLRFKKQSDPTEGVRSKLKAIPFDQVKRQLYEKSSLAVQDTLPWTDYVMSFSDPNRASSGGVLFLTDLDICNELLKMAENKMEAAERKKLKPLWEEWKREFESMKSEHKPIVEALKTVNQRADFPQTELFEAAAKAQEFLQTQKTNWTEMYLHTIRWQDETEELPGVSAHWRCSWRYRQPNNNYGAATVWINSEGACQFEPRMVKSQ